MAQDALSQGSRRDAVDLILDQWRELRPDTDVSGKAVTGRLIRLASLVQRRFGEVFEPLGLDGATYGVLVALRRAGGQEGLTPSALTRELMVTSGGMTPILDRLERAGLVERVPNPADRRGSLVRLTASGRKVVDEAMDGHTGAEHDVVSALTKQERADLARLLRKLLVAVEGPAAPSRPGR